MSQENVEAFKRVIEALNRRDIESLLERYDPDVEARYALESLLGGEAVVHRGHEGVREAFQAGVINHALFMSGMAGTAESGPRRTSRAPLGEVNAPNAPALGQHFWLDVTPSQIDALSVPEWQKIILRAIAKYGMYVVDNGGAPWALQFASGDNYTSFGKPDPWGRYAQSQGIQGSYDSSIGRTVYYFNFKNAVDWASKLISEPGPRGCWRC